MLDIAMLYEEAKYWAPVIGVVTMVYKGASYFKDIGSTVLSIRDNDLKHMHGAVAELKISMDEHTNAVRDHLESQTEVLGRILEKQTTNVVDEIKELRVETVPILRDVRDNYRELKTDLKAHQDVDINVQGYILSGLEVIKNRLEEFHRSTK